MLRDETSRHNYYLQLKANAIAREVNKECTEQSLILLGGLALQADHGDCPDADPSAAADYFRLDDYIPIAMSSSWGTTALHSCHREYRGMSRADAETHYIRETCALQEALNAHVFKMKMNKTDAGHGSVWFHVYAKGIKVYGDDYAPATFLWPNISKLSFERKKFEIRCGEKKTTLYSVNDEKNKLLFSLCKDTHQFSMKIATRLSEAIRREEEESSCLHACYMYSRSLNLPYKNKGDQRISVISSTSSNTTSGIVSDRVHSEDELEIMINTPPAVPVAAPSTESLALAHLLDRPSSVSRQTSSVGRVSLTDLHETLSAAAAAISIRSSNNRSASSASSNSVTSTCQKQVKLAAAASQQQTATSMSAGTAAKEDTSAAAESSPGSQHKMGSQCSSTCSTIVVQVDTVVPSSSSSSTSPTTASRRAPSNSSSLELGYSHTAQNSAISDTATTSIDDYATSHNDEEEAMSGVYTLAHATPTETSGVYTMSNNSELTGQSSEMADSESHGSYYGSFNPNGDADSVENRDSVDGGGSGGAFRKRVISDARDFRMRSDSNVSTSGSFRGDGSDPTDKKHALLSAEELTDLIVGRGTYPSRKTVSDNLDSDCDYVTLPLPLDGDSYLQGNQDTAPTEDGYEDDLLPANPPAPPVRVDSNSSHRMFANEHVRVLPPPYNARHEKTGLCGPPVRGGEEAAPVLPLRDPPPYPQQPIQNTASICASNSSQTNSVNRSAATVTQVSAKLAATSASVAGSTTSSCGSNSNLVKPEEASARFITTKPQINILKAHTSVIGENPKPSFAAPTVSSVVAHSSIPLQPKSHSISQHHSHHPQHSHHNHQPLQQQLQPPPPPSPLQLQHHIQRANSSIGIPIVPYQNIPSTAAAAVAVSNKHNIAAASISVAPPPYPEIVKQQQQQQPRTCVLLPVIKPRQYLPPPPPTLPRQPPPPPPPHLATVYTSQLARSQIELYQQQLYSDVDYVIYPLQDPAVSQQEYLDAKQGSLLAAMAQSPPPPPYLAYHTGSHHGTWDTTCKGHAIYRSTPYLSMAYSTHSRYASTQNLSDTYVQLPGTYSPMYSPSVASLCSSYEPPPPPPLRSSRPMQTANAAAMFSRSKSDDNILNSIIETAGPKMRRLPPPPPPPYDYRKPVKPIAYAKQAKPPPLPPTGK